MSLTGFEAIFLISSVVLIVLLMVFLIILLLKTRRLVADLKLKLSKLIEENRELSLKLTSMFDRNNMLNFENRKLRGYIRQYTDEDVKAKLPEGLRK